MWTGILALTQWWELLPEAALCTKPCHSVISLVSVTHCVCVCNFNWAFWLAHAAAIGSILGYSPVMFLSEMFALVKVLGFLWNNQYNPCTAHSLAIVWGSVAPCELSDQTFHWKLMLSVQCMETGIYVATCCKYPTEQQHTNTQNVQQWHQCFCFACLFVGELA